jgi:hypothetical protein
VNNPDETEKRDGAYVYREIARPTRKMRIDVRKAEPEALAQIAKRLQGILDAPNPSGELLDHVLKHVLYNPHGCSLQPSWCFDARRGPSARIREFARIAL